MSEKSIDAKPPERTEPSPTPAEQKQRFVDLCEMLEGDEVEKASVALIRPMLRPRKSDAGT